ncbi:MAG: hypothetical protein LBQ37_04970 [Elusimicrobiota bacterium]|jgi:hypothetical protein|nr:hypothetical protein [Elusimicrobiota bacterium]
MKKARVCVMFCMSMFLGLVLFAGCASKATVAATVAQAAAAPAVAQAAAPAEPNIRPIDWQGKALGRAMPEWVNHLADGDASELERMDRFQGKEVFIIQQRGKNLDLLESWANNFGVQAQVSRQVSNKVNADFGGAAAGNLDEGGKRLLEEVVGTLSKTKFSGLTKRLSYWIKIRTTDSEKGTVEDMYTFYLVYDIDKTLFQDQIDAALGKVAAKTAEEQDLKNKIKEKLDSLKASDLND